AMPLRHGHLDVAGALLVAEGTAERRGPDALPARAFVHETFRDVQVVHVERSPGILGLALRVGDGAAQDFFDIARHALAGEAQDVERLLRALPADQIHDQARLLRRDARIAHQGTALDRLRDCG